MPTERPIRVLFSCTGVGVFNRGIESFFREAFDGLRGTSGLDATLVKGAGPDAPGERRVWCLPRTGAAARGIGRAVRRNGYVVEQLTSLPGIARAVRQLRPDVVFYSDVNMAMRLRELRPLLGVPFRMVYSNGAPLGPPFTGADHVQQVAPHYLEQALAAGEPPAKHSLVPYGINVPAGDPVVGPAAKRAARAALGLPPDRAIVLSVGWIAATHKRMDYTIDEVASLPHPRPFLVMLGNVNEQSPPVIALAEEKLGRENFTARSVPYEQVARHYQAADVFILSSLAEGFGRVYLESLVHGLPTIAHDHPVMRFVVGEAGVVADLSVSGNGAAAIAGQLRVPQTADLAARRRASVRERFGWPRLAPAYVRMFRDAVAGGARP